MTTTSEASTKLRFFCTYCRSYSSGFSWSHRKCLSALPSPNSKKVATTATDSPKPGKPMPTSIPMPDTNHIVEAVVMPVTLSPVFRMTPAPRKPTPETICADIRPGSTVSGAPAITCQDRIDARVNSADPEHMKMFVLRPAGFPAHSLSSPTRAPQRHATVRRVRALCSSRM